MINLSYVALGLDRGRPAGELTGKSTVADCFRLGRRRLNSDLVLAIVQTLHPDAGYVTQWRQALRVIGGETRAAAQVRVQDTLPPELPGFTGRAAELARLRQALRHGAGNGGPAVIAGMAGVGKTRLAVHTGHLLARDEDLDRVLFVNLRGFHPDPAQPPADPAAVLDGFLRLLGASGQQIPHDLPARTAAYRDRLAGTRTLVVLDNAAGTDQVAPLLPHIPGCPVLLTSRRSLAALDNATHLAIDVFSPDEALAFLTTNAAGIPAGADPHAATRIAGRCGHLPLALSLVTAHMRAQAGWTITDHADRLDARHHQRRLDSGVQLALDLSYQQLPEDRQRLLRLMALHPGQDLDAYAAAALADTDLPAVRAHLHQLCRDHLLQPATPGRYTQHDLVRAYAADRAGDDDPPPAHRAARSRLFDFYLVTAATAMDTLHPTEKHRRSRIRPIATPMPPLADLDTARTWLDTERPTLVAVAAHTAAHGWPSHTTRLATTLDRYLVGGYPSDALSIHGHAHQAARHTGDTVGQADALTSLGATHMQLDNYQAAAEHLDQAVALFRQVSDQAGMARALTNRGNVEGALGHFPEAAAYQAQALHLYRQAGDRVGEARTENNLGILDIRRRHHPPAAAHFEQALALFRRVGDRAGEANALSNLGSVENELGWHAQAAEHLQQSLTLSRQLGNRIAEAWTLDNLGDLHTRTGQPIRAAEHYLLALAVFREMGDRGGEACTANDLGAADHSAGRPADALCRHTAALEIALDIGDRYQQARAHTGLGHAHHALDNRIAARHHYQHALTLYTDLGVPDAVQARAHLAICDEMVEPN